MNMDTELDAPLAVGRAPTDRLLWVCLAAATSAYVVWLVVLQIWPPEPEREAQQGFHGFVAGSSQPLAGPGERSPATAGEVGSSVRGTSGYWFGGGTPRPIAEGAARVPAPEASSPGAAALGSGRSQGPVPSTGANSAARSLGRLGLHAWVTARVADRIAGFGARLVERLDRPAVTGPRAGGPRLRPAAPR